MATAPSPGWCHDEAGQSRSAVLLRRCAPRWSRYDPGFRASRATSGTNRLRDRTETHTQSSDGWTACVTGCGPVHPCCRSVSVAGPRRGSGPARCRRTRPAAAGPARWSRPWPVGRLGQVGRDGDRGSAGRADLPDGLADRAGQRRCARLGGTGRDRHRRAPGREPPRDLGSNAAAGAGDDGNSSIQHAHAAHCRAGRRQVAMSG